MLLYLGINVDMSTCILRSLGEYSNPRVEPELVVERDTDHDWAEVSMSLDP